MGFFFFRSINFHNSKFTFEKALLQLKKKSKPLKRIPKYENTQLETNFLIKNLRLLDVYFSFQVKVTFKQYYKAHIFTVVEKLI